QFRHRGLPAPSDMDWPVSLVLHVMYSHANQATNPVAPASASNSGTLGAPLQRARLRPRRWPAIDLKAWLATAARRVSFSATPKSPTHTRPITCAMSARLTAVEAGLRISPVLAEIK